MASSQFDAFDASSLIVDKKCVPVDAWKYESAIEFSGCQQGRARVWAIWITLVALLFVGLAAFLFVKGSVWGGIIVGALSLAVIAYMWWRVFYVGQKTAAQWEEMNKEKQVMLQSGKSLAEANAYFDERKMRMREMNAYNRSRYRYGYGGGSGLTINL